jgi:uncharacterized membrane protein YraQ (UPF0718 family)
LQRGKAIPNEDAAETFCLLSVLRLVSLAGIVNRSSRFLRQQFLDPSTLLFIGLAVGSGVLLGWLRGLEAFRSALTEGLALLVMIIPVILAAMIISGYVQRLVPSALVERWLGSGSGLRGLAIATVGGALTPGGPFAAFPLVVGLYRAGASFEICVAYLTAWTVLGLNRVLVWEIPFLGMDFALLRLAVSLPLPALAWLLAKLLAGRRQPHA